MEPQGSLNSVMLVSHSSSGAAVWKSRLIRFADESYKISHPRPGIAAGKPPTIPAAQGQRVVRQPFRFSRAHASPRFKRSSFTRSLFYMRTLSDHLAGSNFHPRPKAYEKQGIHVVKYLPIRKSRYTISQVKIVSSGKSSLTARPMTISA